MNDPRITDVIEVSQLSVTLSANRPPIEDDKVLGITVVFWDTLNKNAYISVTGGDWEYLATKGVREQVYVGTFDKASSTVTHGDFDAVLTGIGFGVNTATEHYRVISELRSGDKLFVGTKQLNVTSISFASAQYTVFGDWEEDFSGLTFDTSESIYYSRQNIFIYETIWSGSVGHGNLANQSLNAGKKFSDYEMVTVRVGGRQHTVLTAEFIAHGLRSDSISRWITFVDVNDTTWRVTGGNGETIREFVGIKVG